MGEGPRIRTYACSFLSFFLAQLINRICIARGRRNSRPTARVSPNSSLGILIIILFFSWKSNSTDLFYIRFTIKAVRFIADDQAFFVSKLGLVLDASPVLGAPRAKVYISLPCFTCFFLSLTYLSILGCVSHSALSLSQTMTPSRP